MLWKVISVYLPETFLLINPQWYFFFPIFVLRCFSFRNSTASTGIIWNLNSFSSCLERWRYPGEDFFAKKNKKSSQTKIVYSIIIRKPQGSGSGCGHHDINLICSELANYRFQGWCAAPSQTEAEWGRRRGEAGGGRRCDPLQQEGTYLMGGRPLWFDHWHGQSEQRRTYGWAVFSHPFSLRSTSRLRAVKMPTSSPWKDVVPHKSLRRK